MINFSATSGNHRTGKTKGPEFASYNKLIRIKNSLNVRIKPFLPIDTDKAPFRNSPKLNFPFHDANDQKFQINRINRKFEIHKHHLSYGNEYLKKLGLLLEKNSENYPQQRDTLSKKYLKLNQNSKKKQLISQGISKISSPLILNAQIRKEIEFQASSNQGDIKQDKERCWKSTSKLIVPCQIECINLKSQENEQLEDYFQVGKNMLLDEQEKGEHDYDALSLDNSENQLNRCKKFEVYNILHTQYKFYKSCPRKDKLPSLNFQDNRNFSEITSDDKISLSGIKTCKSSFAPIKLCKSVSSTVKPFQNAIKKHQSKLNQKAAFISIYTHLRDALSKYSINTTTYSHA